MSEISLNLSDMWEFLFDLPTVRGDMSVLFHEIL